MKRLIFPFLLFVFSSFNLLQAQGVLKKWAIVQDLDDRIVYLDTTTIREFDNKITIWSLVIYRQPKDVNPLQQKVSQIKSQFMINSLLKKYSVIGTLYYDSKGKMIGETSIPNYNYNTGDNFSIAIVEGSTIDVLLNKAKDYLVTGKFADERSQFLKNYDKATAAKNTVPLNEKNSAKDTLVPEKEISLDVAALNKLKQATQVDRPVKDTTLSKMNVKTPVKAPEIKKDSIKAMDNSVSGVDKLVNSKIDSSKIKAAKEKLIKKDTTALGRIKKDLAGTQEKANPSKIDPVPETKKAVEIKTPEKKQTEKEKPVKEESKGVITTSGYDNSKETNPSGVIFTDGRLFCFQVSSWKIKSQADRELARLQAAGHNAFIQEADVKNKGKWYRVRVGYFNSLKEAADYKKKVK